MHICACYESGYQKIRPLSEQFTAAQDEQIRKQFPFVNPVNKNPLALPENTRPNAPAAKTGTGTVECTAIYHETQRYTGYARIDNAIVDAMTGKSVELKDNVYDIIRNDLLPATVHGLSEDDRHALISMGVEKAQYLADQFMGENESSSFMNAIRSIAKIGMAGRRVGTCEMEYDIKFAVCIDGRGYVHDDIREELLFTMERESPEDFETYKKKSGSDAVWFAAHWLMDGRDYLLNNNKDAFNRYKDEQYRKLDDVKLDTTFSGTDKSSKKNFLASLVEKLQANQTLQTKFFLERISHMVKAPDEYLVGMQRYVSTWWA